jgi:hypothetical protein
VFGAVVVDVELAVGVGGELQRRLAVDPGLAEVFQSMRAVRPSAMVPMPSNFPACRHFLEAHGRSVSVGWNCQSSRNATAALT